MHADELAVDVDGRVAGGQAQDSGFSGGVFAADDVGDDACDGVRGFLVIFVNFEHQCVPFRGSSLWLDNVRIVRRGHCRDLVGGL